MTAGRVGEIAELVVYPLKSAQGVPQSEIRVQQGGLQGDRDWALTLDGALAGATQVPELAGLQVSVREGRLWLADGRTPAEPATLAALLGVAADRLGLIEGESLIVAGRHRVAAVHLVSANAPGLPGCGADPRANLVLRLAQPGAERDWVGRRLLVGECELVLTRVPKKCLGVYAEVARAGVVRVGDQVVLAGDQT